MDEKQFNILLERIDKLSRVMVIQAVKDIPKEQDKIELLDSIGFRPTEIGKLLGKSAANVSVVLGNLRKKKDIEASRREETAASLGSTQTHSTVQDKGGMTDSKTQVNP